MKYEIRHPSNGTASVAFIPCSHVKPSPMQSMPIDDYELFWKRNVSLAVIFHIEYSIRLLAAGFFKNYFQPLFRMNLYQICPIVLCRSLTITFAQCSGLCSMHGQMWCDAPNRRHFGVRWSSVCCFDLIYNAHSRIRLRTATFFASLAWPKCVTFSNQAICTRAISPLLLSILARIRMKSFLICCCCCLTYTSPIVIYDVKYVGIIAVSWRDMCQSTRWQAASPSSRALILV